MSTTLLLRYKNPHLPNKCTGYDTKPPYGHASVLELWGMWNTLALPLLPGLLCPGWGIPVRVPSMGQIEELNLLLGIIIIK